MEKLQVTGDMSVIGPDPESPIEEMFQYEFSKFGNPELILERQVEIIGYRVDFLVRNKGRVIVFECDGKEFHNPSADADRDERLLASGKVDVIYRILGNLICYHLHDALLLISHVEPGVFAERAPKVLYGPTTQKDSIDIFSTEEDGSASKDVEVYTTSNLDPEILWIHLHWRGKSEVKNQSPIDVTKPVILTP